MNTNCATYGSVCYKSLDFDFTVSMTYSSKYVLRQEATNTMKNGIVDADDRM